VPPFVEIDLALRQGGFELQARADVGAEAAVLGPSGAGKTTLLEAIAGLRRARGRLAVGGAVLQDGAARIFVPPERRRLGYVPQQGALFPHLSVRSNLVFGRPGRGGGEARAGSDFDALVALLDLEPLLDRYPRHLSGGEERRVALGRALLARPRLLLLDEPTAGLDPLRARKALAGIRRARAELGVPLLLVTHDEQEALALAAEVVLLEAGRVRAAGPARPVLLAARAGNAAGTAGDRPWENVVSARLLRHRPEGGTSEVLLIAGGTGEGEGGGMVAIPHLPDVPPGAEILLAIDAEDLLIATLPPAGLSARNAVAGRVDELIPSGPSVYVRVGPWLAHLTLAAVDDLGLRAGTPVWLVAKTHSWRVAAG
jgi:molybdate transport system ATP-binding protein